MRRSDLRSAGSSRLLQLWWQRHGAEMVALIIAITAVPLLLGWVPPNPYYGFRTPASMKTLEAWYRANQIMAWYLLASQALGLPVKSHVSRMLIARWGKDEATWATPWVCVAALLGVLAAVAHFYMLG